MIHLFNNVTLKNISSINFSTPNFQIVTTDFSTDYYRDVTGCTLEDFDLAQFITDTGNDRVVVYCDTESLASIVALFFKSTLNLNDDAYAELVATYDYRAQSFPNYTEGFIASAISAWTDVEAVELPEVTHSFEILLTNAFINADSVKDKLNPILSSFILRQHKNIISEAKGIVENNITSIGIQEIMGNSDKALPFSKKEDLDWTLYNSEDINEDVMNWADLVFAASEPGVDSPSLGWPFVSEVVDGDLSDDSYTTVINDIKSASVGVPYMPEDLIDTINTQLIGYTRNCTKTKLEKYKIK